LKQELSCGTHSFSYFPGPGIAELSQRLADLVAGLRGDRPIVLIGHSLGGLVVSHYVAHERAGPRIAATLCLAAPFLGSSRHFLVPGAAGRDVARGSPMLERLASGEGRPADLPHLSILAGEDRLIEPGAYPAFGDQLLIPRAGHNAILFDPDAIEAVLTWMRSLHLGAEVESAVRSPIS
jgi:hypothetical protein